MSISVADWRKVLDLVSSNCEKGEDTEFFLAAEHDTIYFTCFEGVKVKSKLGIQLEELGLFCDNNMNDNLWMIYV